MYRHLAVAIVVIGALLLLGGCVVVPTVKPTGAPVAATHSTCPPIFEKDAVEKYGRPDIWVREYREPPTVYPLFKCEWMQPFIEWAKSASPNEWERGGCTGSHTSFTCRSERGPSGTSRRGSEKNLQGEGRIMFGVAYAALTGCPSAAAEHRELTVTVNAYGPWRWYARHACYW